MACSSADPSADAGGLDASADGRSDVNTPLDTNAFSDAPLDATADVFSAIDVGPDDTAAPRDAPMDAPTRDQSVSDSASSPACGCQVSAGLCSEEFEPRRCPAFNSLCNGARVASCDRDGVLYTCMHPHGAVYNSRYFFDDYAAQSRQCETSFSGTFVTTHPPDPVGAACSCARTASLCITVYGAGCSRLSCDTPAVRSDSACADTNALPAQCVSLDGQRRVSYYGISSLDAQQNCRAQTGYYWVPAR